MKLIPWQQFCSCLQYIRPYSFKISVKEFKMITISLLLTALMVKLFSNRLTSRFSLDVAMFINLDKVKQQYSFDPSFSVSQ